MNQTHDRRESVVDQRGRRRWERIALACSSLVLAGCPPGPQVCSPGKELMNSKSAYAAYVGNTGQVVELIQGEGIVDRCITPLSSAPPVPPPVSAPAPLPTCAGGKTPSPPTAYYAQYFDKDDVKLQLEDVRALSRCIMELPPASPACPPPSGWHITNINGTQYCVP